MKGNLDIFLNNTFSFITNFRRNYAIIYGQVKVKQISFLQKRNPIRGAAFVENGIHI